MLQIGTNRETIIRIKIGAEEYIFEVWIIMSYNIDEV